MDTTLLGERIRQYREQRGLTQEELSQRIGVSSNHLSVLERGIKAPRLGTFLSIAQALQITPNELLYSENYEPTLSDLTYKLGQLPAEKQKQLIRIMDAIAKEL